MSAFLLLIRLLQLSRLLKLLRVFWLIRLLKRLRLLKLCRLLVQPAAAPQGYPAPSLCVVSNVKVPRLFRLRFMRLRLHVSPPNHQASAPHVSAPHQAVLPPQFVHPPFSPKVSAAPQAYLPQSSRYPHRPPQAAANLHAPMPVPSKRIQTQPGSSSVRANLCLRALPSPLSHGLERLNINICMHVLVQHAHPCTAEPSPAKRLMCCSMYWQTTIMHSDSGAWPCCTSQSAHMAHPTISSSTWCAPHSPGQLRPRVKLRNHHAALAPRHGQQGPMPRRTTPNRAQHRLVALGHQTQASQPLLLQHLHGVA